MHAGDRLSAKAALIGDEFEKNTPDIPGKASFGECRATYLDAVTSPKLLVFREKRSFRAIPSSFRMTQRYQYDRDRSGLNCKAMT